MIEFLSDYSTVFSLIIWIIIVFCMLFTIKILNVIYTEPLLYKVIIGVLISIIIPAGLIAVADEMRSYKMHNNKHIKTCIYINNKLVGCVVGERDEFIN